MDCPGLCSNARRGLKLGLYTSTSGGTCTFRPGSWGHYEIDARTFADWGVDYLKIDNCWMPGGWDPQWLYSRFSAAIRATRAPITISISDAWPRSVAPWSGPRATGTSGGPSRTPTTTICLSTTGRRRTGGGGDGALDDNAPLYPFARPGAFNDADILEVGLRGLTFRENRTIMGLWSMMAAPLLAGNDLTTMTPATASVLANRRIIAIDQDPLGRRGPGTVRRVRGGVGVREARTGGRRAVMVFNRSATERVIVTNLRAVLRSRLRASR